MEVFHSQLGGCLVSKHIRDKTGLLTWCIHEESKNDLDTGWIFLADNDTEEYLNDVSNWCCWPFEWLIEIEPLALYVYTLPVGTELTLVREEKKSYFVDTNTGEPLGKRRLSDICPWLDWEEE